MNESDSLCTCIVMSRECHLPRPSRPPGDPPPPSASRPALPPGAALMIQGREAWCLSLLGAGRCGFTNIRFQHAHVKTFLAALANARCSSMSIRVPPPSRDALCRDSSVRQCRSAARRETKGPAMKWPGLREVTQKETVGSGSGSRIRAPRGGRRQGARSPCCRGAYTLPSTMLSRYGLSQLFAKICTNRFAIVRLVTTSPMFRDP